MVTQVRKKIEDCPAIINLLDKADEMMRVELSVQSGNGDRFQIDCLLEARVNVKRAVEALHLKEESIFST
jgi:hypothetical protein